MEKPKSWATINKSRKEEKRKWRDESLAKKMDRKKQKLEREEATLSAPQKAPSPAPSTVSIAVPGSILENAQSPELRAYLAGQIARAACIFQVDEIVVFDDYCNEANARTDFLVDSYGEKTARECCVQLARILQYLECPQYLRKHFFPIHKHLKFCGLLNPLNAPHHLGKHDESEYREGVVLNKALKPGRGSIANVGLLKDVHLDKVITPCLRCTVQLLPEDPDKKKRKGVVVSPAAPRNETGVYWGYTVRLATSLSSVFSECPHKGGYDLTVGTSDKGSSVDEFACPKFKHMLIVFGGVQGLESALESDNSLNADDPKFLFKYYLNTLPNQGSKTIRTEEAILVSMAALRARLNPEISPRIFDSTEVKTVHVAKNLAGAVNKAKSTEIVDDLSRFD